MTDPLGAPADSAPDACDVLIVGAGAAGLAAGVAARLLGLRTLIIEKTDVVGGTAATSGGVIWIPCNPFRAGVPDPDTAVDARRYLLDEAGESKDELAINAYIEAAGDAVQFFSNHGALSFVGPPVWPDYHQGLPGARDGGRSMRIEAFDGRILGPHLHLLRKPLPSMTVFGDMMVSAQDHQHVLSMLRSARSLAHVCRILLRHMADRFRFGRSTRLVNGSALIARLLHTYLGLGGQLRTETRLIRILSRDGRVTGAEVRDPSGAREVQADRGVFLATGGSPHNTRWRGSRSSAGSTVPASRPLAPAANEGDGFEAADRVGAAFDSQVNQEAAWAPVSRVLRPSGEESWFPHFFDRSKPGFIMVNNRGRRFVNEAASYHDIGIAMRQESLAPGGVAFIVCDDRALLRYGVGVVAPFRLAVWLWTRRGYVIRGRTPEDLAVKLGLDPSPFVETLQRYNACASEGTDLAFGKGTTSYERYIGDAQVVGNPCVAPLDRAPYYGIPVRVGDLGTFAGLRVNADSQVLARDGAVVPGLYAIGNDRRSAFGGTYPAAGITLGPALVFAYRAAAHAASPERPGASRHVPVPRSTPSAPRP